MLEGILAISGKSGLYKLVSQSRANLLVESLADGKKMPVSGTSRVSALQEISMYTYEGDVRLANVMANIYNLTEGKPCLSEKSTDEELKAFMDKALPQWDKEHVYVSDIKKLVAWYNILLSAGLVSGNAETEEAEEESK